MDFPGGSDGTASVYNVGDLGSIPGSGRFPGEGNGNPLQYSCLEHPINGGDWWATVHGGLEELDTTERLHFTTLGKSMAAHSSILAWEILGQRSLAGYSPWG